MPDKTEQVTKAELAFKTAQYRQNYRQDRERGERERERKGEGEKGRGREGGGRERERERERERVKGIVTQDKILKL